MKNISVLVIDDSPIIRKRIKDILGESRSIKQLLFAGNYPEGRSLIDLNDPDVVLLDINLPDGKGLNNLYELRKSYPALKVVIITNQEFEKYEEVSMRLGAYCYIDKSYDFHKIPSVIDQISRSHASFLSA
jgi:DNA-binding NarL/FixJ family response regulator